MTVFQRTVALVGIAALVVAIAAPAPANECVSVELGDARPAPRVIRYYSEAAPCGDDPCFGLVLETEAGRPSTVFNLTKWRPMLGSRIASFVRTAERSDPNGFDLAKRLWDRHLAAPEGKGLRSIRQLRSWIESLDPDDSRTNLAPVIEPTLAELRSGSVIGVGVGLNYAEHAAETGGGDVFYFPKTVQPTAPFRDVRRPDGVELLDYEVELGFVLLRDLDLSDVPGDDDLSHMLAYFHVNDVTDRTPIFLERGAGFAKAKSRQGTLPAGPWMVRGRELAAFGKASKPLRMGLEVVHDGVTKCRQKADTGLMRRKPREILVGLGEFAASNRELTTEGLREPERWDAALGGPIARLRVVDGNRRFVLPAGSFVVTGTPAGTAAQRPDLRTQLQLVWEAVRTGSFAPSSIFVAQQVRDRIALGYLDDGDMVRAVVEGLGVQQWKVAPSGPRESRRQQP